MTEQAQPGEGFGEECPVCGDPFDPVGSGAMWSGQNTSIDVSTWERICPGPLPEHFNEPADSTGKHEVFVYVHA